MVARYDARLHKEYAVVDLSKHAEGRVGLRWRTEAEVLRAHNAQLHVSRLHTDCLRVVLSTDRQGSTAQLHISGTPCVDWSSAGKRLGGGGPTVLVYFVWVAMRLAYQEDQTPQRSVCRR